MVRFFNVCCLTLLFFSCGFIRGEGGALQSRYGFSSAGVADEAGSLLALIGTGSIQQDYVLLERIIQQLDRDDLEEERNEDALRLDQNALINILQTYLHDNGADRFSAYYNYVIADIYSRRNENSLALLFYRRLIDNCADLVIEGNSLRLSAARIVIALSDSPDERIRLNRLLIDEFPDEVDVDRIHYHLGRDLEAVGRWNEAYASYARFMSDINTIIPGEPDARSSVYSKFIVRNASRDWIKTDNLYTLIGIIKNAVEERNYDLITECQTDNFFGISGFTQSEIELGIGFSLFSFIGSGIQFVGLTENSNQYEALYKTTGWGVAVRDWYFYFRRIDYPANPEIHGKWQWHGVFFGETF